MSVILSKAPLRISLGGGGTDLPSYYEEHGGFLVAGAINKYVYILLHAAFQKTYQMKYSEIEVVKTPAEIRHPILRETLLRHWAGEPVEISSIADVPAGTGMGSSGTFTVALLKALAQAQHLPTTPNGLAESACEIEIDVLKEPIGKQDQYAAAHGGICAYTFNTNGSVEVEPLLLTQETIRRLRDHLMLFYTGETRSASVVLSDQTTRSKAGDKEMLDNLHRTKEMGYLSRKLLESGDLVAYAKLMDEHWQNKRKRSAGMANERIDDLYGVARQHGAIGGKLVGAGGGGFLLIYTKNPSVTREAMEKAGAPELPFEFDFGGATASGLV